MVFSFSHPSPLSTMETRERKSLVCALDKRPTCLFFSLVPLQRLRRGSSSPKPLGLRVAASCQAEIQRSVYGSGFVCAEAVFCQETVHKHRQAFWVIFFFELVPSAAAVGAKDPLLPLSIPLPFPSLPRPISTRRRQRWRSRLSWSCWSFFLISSVSSSGCYGYHLLLFPRVHHSFYSDSVYLLDVGAPTPTASLACARAFIEADIPSRRKVPWDSIKRGCHPPSISPIEYKQPLICSPSVLFNSAHLTVLGPILPPEETLDRNEGRQRL